MSASLYVIRKADTPPSLLAEVGVTLPGWDEAEVGVVDTWHYSSREHRPLTYFRVLYDTENMYVRFDVMDRHVRSLKTRPQSLVCNDSCVEFFVQPAAVSAYFNFEINAGGTPHVSFIEDPRRIPAGGFEKYCFVSDDWLEQLDIGHSLPRKIKRVIHEPIAWSVAYKIPFALFKAYTGEFKVQKNTTWRGNFFKCGGDPKYEHWGCWSDIGMRLDYHQPEKFGVLVFG
ncbi:MAG: hypothetical protein GX804_06780 [Lentisphaerae bacterium]|jgi:hypothetical protein|nr:hypothetical protein [Lentisphaerota bacterium]